MKSQNERIEIKDDTYVRIALHGGRVITLTADGVDAKHATTLWVGDQCVTLDHEGRRALIEALECADSTPDHDFKGLRTDNAIPWPGKRVWYDIGESITEYVHSGHSIVVEEV